MFQGFYNLTAGVLTQNRKLNVISNNMANVSTPGFKSEQFISTTFQEEMIYRSGNKDKSSTPIGSMNRIVTADENINDFTPVAYETTGSALDFALKGKGFFCVQTDNGMLYTRYGSFILDNEGYLSLQGIGRVQGQDGPIQVGNTKITADSLGNIYSEEDNRLLGRLSVVDFDNYAEQLNQSVGSVYVYSANVAGTPVNGDIVHKALELSNVDPIKEMTEMMGSQRALQSSAQVLKIYDQLTGKIVSQLGPV